MKTRSQAVKALLALAATALVGAATVPAASVAADTPTPACPTGVTYDPSVLSWDAYWNAAKGGAVPAGAPDDTAALASKAVVPLGFGAARAGGGATAGGVGSDPSNPTGRNLNLVLRNYANYLVNATAANPRVKVIRKVIGTSSLGKPMEFYAVSTPGNIGNLDGPDGDAAYWRGVRAGDISEEDGLEAAITRPAFGWITATPHGDESAAGESITRELYELAARTDCSNLKRIGSMDLFLQPVRNPDGHDAVTRTTAWAFDPNRDFGTRNYVENDDFIPKMNEYPGLFFIDAHQQGGSAYFFPPNEDPVHHEISSFSLDTIQNKIGPALQKAFNDTSTLYQNYNQYDLFTPEYGDTVPSLIMGAAGMTYEKGNAEVYSKQVYDHYLAIDQTINTIANDKINTTRDWVRQWQDAVQQGQNCELQPNKLVSPLHDELSPVPADKRVCGYFFKPGQHTGDVAKLIQDMQEVGVKVFRVNSDTALSGVKEYGKDAGAQTLPAGTLYIPMNQGMKHWIQAVMGENPFIPYPFYYDVVTWSYGMQRGLAGAGFLTQPGSVPTDLTQIGAPDLGGAPATTSAVYAFNTDSMRGLALATDLLSKDVDVSRATSAFTSGSTKFFTGAALVSGTSLAAKGIDLSALAKERQTPVVGLDRYPVARKRLTTPKIGVYTGSASVPSNPIIKVADADNPSVTAPGELGHCALSSGGASFCEAFFTLREKDDLPASAVVPLTSAQLTTEALTAKGITAIVNPGSTITGTASDAIKAFVNAGGRYVGYGTGGAATARNSGLSNVSPALYLNPSTQPTAQALTVPPSMKTPGSTYDAKFDTTDPVSWGFDLGGWIYRSSSSDPMFEPASLGTSFTSPALNATPGYTVNNPASTAAVSYATDLNSAASLNGQKYGLSVNATGPGLLDGRPAVVSSGLGSGHSTVFGYNPFFRAWKDQDERLVLNAALYPTTPDIAPDAAPAAKVTPETVAAAPEALTAATTKEETPALPAKKLPVVKKKTAPKAVHDVAKDFQIVVKQRYATKLKQAVKVAKLPKSIRKKVSFKTSGKKVKLVTLTIKNARTDDFHDRQEWVSSLMNQVEKRKIKVKLGQM